MDKMKRTAQMIVLCLLLAACSKQPQAPTVPSPAPDERISRLEYDNNHISITYHTDGSIGKVVNTWLSGGNALSYDFQYANGKISEVRSEGKWVYEYVGDKLTKIQTHNDQGIVKYEVVFTYSGSQVTERTEYLITTSGANPYFRTFYTYDSNGNVIKKEIHQYVNHEWKYSEHILYSDYDNTPNYVQQFESYPYISSRVFGGNNPRKEVYMENNTVRETVEYTYTYDALGRTKTRLALHKPVGFAEYTERTAMVY